MSRFLAYVLPLALFATCATAQTSAICQPLNSTCAPDNALGITFNETFDASTTALNPKLWNATVGGTGISFGKNGADMTLSQKGQSITVESTFYIFWGRVEVMLQAAAGQGIVSTFILLSDDLDEVDLEIKGGNTSYVYSNWYGHGNTTQLNGGDHPVDGPQESMHNYTVLWDQNRLEWHIDGNLVRTVPYAPSGQYPQTPSQVKLGIWSAGDSPQEGTVEWAGGKTDWSKAPFTMTVQSIKITDGSTNTTAYTYGDQTGSYESIKLAPGISEAAKIVNKPSTLEATQKHWNGLSTTAKIAIACSVGGVILLVVLIYTVVCIVQRKKGRAEKAKADKEWDEHQNELMAYRSRMARGDFAISHMGHGAKF